MSLNDRLLGGGPEATPRLDAVSPRAQSAVSEGAAVS